ncbi:multi-sensor hybrid histidine kinase [Hymenobacter roseosalivarius DSM 11622]|uniref:Sensory/regulatory protein RpfC n=1 Tax=Hymenobacter roseosalivarius DSM 11622 TaxID=645990 RepID=A0A1W1VZ75_9BACT|nr:PAS domain S-box protein [Hymenobacter roseosalivarius]SMB98154.1 multi-sensor hybrid histidine kinase [Hymenobacter roseosalivarius DSM 11622]
MEQSGVHTSSIPARVTPNQPLEDTTLPDGTPDQLQQALLLIQQAFAAVAIIDDQGHLEWTNEGFAKLFGGTSSTLSGQVLWQILPPAFTDTTPHLPPTASLSAQTAFQYQGRTTASGGPARWIRARVQPGTLPASHEPTRFFVLLEDITAWKAEQVASQAHQTQQRHLLEQVPGVLFQWRHTYDGTSQLTYLSDNAPKILGCKPAHLAHLEGLVHPDDRAAWVKFWRHPHRVGAASFEGRLLVLGYPLRWFQADCQPSATDAEGVLYSGILQDITSLKEAEQAVQSSEQRWHLAIERFGDGAWEFNYQTGDEYFSNAYRTMLGYPNEDFPAGFHGWQNHVHPDDHIASMQASDAYLRGEVPIYSVERRLLCKNGEYKWVLTRGLVTKRDANGDPLIMTGVHTDISAIKQANLAIEASTRRLSTTIANFQEGILLEDENRHVVLVNEAFCRMLNTQVLPEQLVGVETAALLAAGDFPVELGWLEGADGRVLEQQAVIGELLPRKNGKVFQRDFIPIFSHNASLGYLWKFQDVTEQKNAEEILKRREEKYRRIIERMNLGLIETDLTDQVVYINQAFCDMLGFSGTEIMEQELLHSLLAQNDFTATPDDTDAYERMVVSKDGGQKWLLVSRAPVYDDDRQSIGSIHITLDITHQKNLEHKLRKAKEHAEDSSKAKELFLANMSHEIRTPMNAILGMAQLLAKTPLTPDQDEYLRAVTISGENLLVIINDILDLSKIEAGQLQVEKIGFGASQLMAQIEQTLHYKAEEKGLYFVTKVSPELPTVLLGDPYRITQVLLNLAGNAIKFTEKGSVTISCELLQQVDDAVEIRFLVTDTGIGIDPTYLNHIFKEFSQEDSSVTRKFGGTGLGLSISKSLVNLMGGELLIESEKHRGTVSSFSLLLQIGSESDLPRKEAADQGLRERLRGKEVLLVEDNKFNRQIAKALLNNAHIHVTEMENGALAVELLQTRRFDLILMDMQMPVMNGLEATALLREQMDVKTPIIALTANAIKGEREKCLAAGMNDYLAKPFQEDELLKLIGDWVLEPAAGGPRTSPIAPGSLVRSGSPAPLYKLDLLHQVGQGDDDFVALMLDSFIESCEEAVHDLTQALQTHDSKLLKAATHKLKPSLDHLHVNQALPLVEQLDSWEGDVDPQALQPRVETVNSLLREVIEQMRLDIRALAAKKAP